MVSVESMGGVVLNILIIVVAGIVAVGIAVGMAVFVQKWRRYNEYDVVIWGNNGFGQAEQIRDKAGVFVDKATNSKRLFLKKAKVSLNADRIPYLPQGKNRIIYLFRVGLKNFRYIKPVLSDKVGFQVGEEDVNWALEDYERGKKAFRMDKLLQYMPYIALGFTAVVILIIVIYLIQKFDVIEAASANLAQAAQDIARARAGTAIIE